MKTVEAKRLVWLQQRAADYVNGNGGSPDPEGKLAAKGSHRRPLAIAARCWQCVGGRDDPKPAEQIENCAQPRCALHPHRPYQSGGYKANLETLKAQTPAIAANTVVSPLERAHLSPADRAQAVRGYCYECMGGQPAGQKHANGNVRKLVGECSSAYCALWDVRPWRNEAENGETPSFSENDLDDESPETEESKLTRGNASAMPTPETNTERAMAECQPND